MMHSTFQNNIVKSVWAAVTAAAASLLPLCASAASGQLAMSSQIQYSTIIQGAFTDITIAGSAND